MTTSLPTVELGPLGLDGGAHVLVKLALSDMRPGDALAVCGTHPELTDHLAVWCRSQGHRWTAAAPGSLSGAVGVVERGHSAGARWIGAVRAGHADAARPDALASTVPADWGLAPRGAAIEPGGPTPSFRLDRRDELWTDRATALYRQAAAAQWDPDAAIDWDARIDNAPAVEAAVVQVMTFLVENEEAALVVPARFLGEVHPHFREIQQVLAITVADEARHIEVFSRRATLTGAEPGLSTVGGRQSLQTLLDEPDFATAAFLLSVMGEGTFLSLLTFLERHGPDPVTRRVAQLARNDEARHVAFAMAHLERHAQLDPSVRSRLARAAERRHRELQTSAGLNEDVFDALVLLAAGEPTPAAVAEGWRRVQLLQHEMNDARAGRLVRLGFSADEADTIASLHTRNFM